MAIHEAMIFTVTSVNGGTGKTTTALNLAGTFATMNYKTLIIDLDLYSGVIGMQLNIDNSKNIFTVIDDMNNNRFTFVENYVTKYSNNIDVLPAPIDPRLASKIGINYISLLLRKAKMKYQVIIIDTTHVLNDVNLMTFDCSDKLLYVINNNPSNLKNLKTYLSIHRDMEQYNYKIILNEATNKGKNYLSNYDIKTIIKDDIDYIIPESFYMKNIDKFTLDGTIPVMTQRVQKSNRKAVNVFRKMASDLIKEVKDEEEWQKKDLRKNLM